MRKLLHVALGVVTSFGGFLEAGSIATSIQAGAEYGYSLLWVLLLDAHRARSARSTGSC